MPWEGRAGRLGRDNKENTTQQGEGCDGREDERVMVMRERLMNHEGLMMSATKAPFHENLFTIVNLKVCNDVTRKSVLVLMWYVRGDLETQNASNKSNVQQLY